MRQRRDPKAEARGALVLPAPRAHHQSIHCRRYLLKQRLHSLKPWFLSVNHPVRYAARLSGRPGIRIRPYAFAVYLPCIVTHSKIHAARARRRLHLAGLRARRFRTDAGCLGRVCPKLRCSIPFLLQYHFATPSSLLSTSLGHLKHAFAGQL